MASEQSIRRFSTLKTTLISGLSLPEAPIDWRWEGRGTTGNLRTRRPDVVTQNNPVAGFTRIVERWTITTGLEIYNAFFSTFPIAQFEKVTLTFDPDEAFFHVNVEEN